MNTKMKKSKTFEAQLDIVNLGIHLKEKGHFEDKLMLMALYLFMLFTTVGT